MRIADALQAEASGNALAQSFKDVAGAQLITKTLDKLNATQTPTLPAVTADSQFQKNVLRAAGLGGRLDLLV